MMIWMNRCAVSRRGEIAKSQVEAEARRSPDCLQRVPTKSFRFGRPIEPSVVLTRSTDASAGATAAAATRAIVNCGRFGVRSKHCLAVIMATLCGAMLNVWYSSGPITIGKSRNSEVGNMLLKDF